MDLKHILLHFFKGLSKRCKMIIALNLKKFKKIVQKQKTCFSLIFKKNLDRFCDIKELLIIP